MSLVSSDNSGLELASSSLKNGLSRSISLDVALGFGILLLSVAGLFPKTAAIPATAAVQKEPTLDERIAAAIKKAAMVTAAKEAKVLANLKANLEAKKAVLAKASDMLDKEKKRLATL